MQIVNDFTGVNLDRDLVATVGTYDGLHRGHQHLVRQLIARAGEVGALSALITFEPHPRRVLHPERPPARLTGPDEKTAILEAMGLDVLVTLHFTPEMSRMRARDFMRAVVEHLRVRELWVGSNFALGRHREGDVAALRRLAQELGFELKVVEVIEADGEPISSTRIRSLILKGQIGEATQLLGRPFTLIGKAIAPCHRKARNAGSCCFRLALPGEYILPADGDYCAYLSLGQQRYPALVSVGTRSDGNEEARAVEVQVPHPDLDLIGQDLALKLVRRQEGTEPIEGLEQLRAQIEGDIQRVEKPMDYMAEPGDGK